MSADRGASAVRLGSVSPGLASTFPGGPSNQLTPTWPVGRAVARWPRAIGDWLMGLPKQNYQSAEISAADPSAVFLVKSLLNPVIAVGSLVVCLLSWDEPLYGPYFLIAVLTFVGTADFLDSAQIKQAKGTMFALQLLLDIAVRWALLIGFLWILLHLSGLTSNFNHDVLRTWAVVTPPALWIGQMACQRLLMTAGSRGRSRRRR